MLTVIGLKTCSTIKKTLKWLDVHEHSYFFRDVKKKPLTEVELLDIVNKLSLETVINKRGTTWKKLNVDGSSLTDVELFDLLLQNQSMIKRPVITQDDAVLIGFDEEALQEFLGND
jgi:Spx/MgsR family transcriptional regulator